MKNFSILIILLISATAAQAQINVRVRSTGNTKEVDIKTGRKPASGSNGNTGKPPAEEKTNPATAEKKDTAIVPSTKIPDDDGYNGPAKSSVTAFYRQAKDAREMLDTAKKYGQFHSVEMKLYGMEGNLKKTKQKDPGCGSLAQMEEIYNSLKKETEAAHTAATNKIASGRKEAADKTQNERLLETVIDGTGMQVGHNNLPYMDQAMADYKAKVEEVLKLDLTKYKVKLDDLKMYVNKSHTLAADRIMESAKTIIKELKDAENFDPVLKELQFRQLYWDAVRKIYAGDAVCEKYYQNISAMLKQIGSPDDIKKTAAKNEAAAIKERKMAAPVVKDAALEKILINGFNSKYGSTYKGTALKAILLQDGWTIERHDVSGIVTGRNRIAQLAYKGSDGKCYLLPQNIYIYQAHVGGSFTNTEVIYNGFSGQEMLCENVK